ncbi:MAG: DUF4097 domain-containing protein [Defluviitaleaceae bacterium]|nr:DUF4097 domain-containing protein [Defluviitaleaceae bacterium]
MNNKTKMILLIIAIVLILGAAIAIPFIASGGGFGSGQIGSGDLDVATFAVGDVRSIDANITVGRVYVQEHSDDGIRVVFEPPATGRYIRPHVSFNEATGALRVYEDRVNINVFGNTRGGVLTIYLPRNIDNNIENFTARTTTGRVNVRFDGALATGNVSLTTTTGRIYAEGFEAGSIRLQSTTGVNNMRHLISQGRIESTTTTGRVEGSNLVAASGEFQTTTGRIELEHLDINGNLSARTTTGRIDLTNSIILGSLSTNTTTGRVNMSNVSHN